VRTWNLNLTVIIQHFTQNLYLKKYTLEFRTSKRKHVQKITVHKRNRPYRHKMCIWRRLGALSRSSLFVRKCADWLSTSLHTHRPFVYNVNYCWRYNTKQRNQTHLFFTSVSLSIVRRYYIRFYAISLPFLIHSVFIISPPPPNLADLSDHLVCLAVKPTLHTRKNVLLKLNHIHHDWTHIIMAVTSKYINVILFIITPYTIS
jgi:hypothetical protein